MRVSAMILAAAAAALLGGCAATQDKAPAAAAPAVAEAPLHTALRSLGAFRGEPVDASRTNAHAAQALQIMQRAGWR